MWKEVTLGDVSEVKAGNSAPQDDALFENGIYPFVRTSDVGAVKVGRLNSARDFLNEKGIEKLKLFKKGTVLFPKSGASTFLNHRVILSMDAYVSSHLATIKADNEYLLDEYIWYYLQTIDAAQLVADSAYPSLQAKTIKEIAIPIPPLATQQRIVAKLDAVFAEIDKLHHTKLTKLANIQRLSAQKISQLVNELNKNCGKTPLSEVCVKITKGSSPKWQGINYVDEPGILFITSENVGNGELRMEKIKYVENKFNEKDSKSILQKGDVLTNIVGASIGRTAVFDLETSISANINQAVCLLRTDGKRLNPHFLSYLLNSDFFLNALHDGETSTARANISLGFLSSLEIPQPSLNEQILFLDECEAITKACTALSENFEKQSALAEGLKAAILSQELKSEVA